MRVARHRQSSTSDSKEKNEMTKEEMEEYGTRQGVNCLYVEYSVGAQENYIMGHLLGCY